MMDFDPVINNGTVIDGTGQSRFCADVGIRDGVLAAVSEGDRLEGHRSMDASNMVVAPGFVDIHSHADWILPLSDHDEIPAVDGFPETMRERDFPS
jgi:N-acyl-D-amino-acid deacylase